MRGHRTMKREREGKEAARSKGSRSAIRKRRGRCCYCPQLRYDVEGVKQQSERAQDCLELVFCYLPRAVTNTWEETKEAEIYTGSQFWASPSTMWVWVCAHVPGRADQHGGQKAESAWASRLLLPSYSIQGPSVAHTRQVIPLWLMISWNTFTDTPRVMHC